MRSVLSPSPAAKTTWTRCPPGSARRSCRTRAPGRPCSGPGAGRQNGSCQWSVASGQWPAGRSRQGRIPLVPSNPSHLSHPSHPCRSATASTGWRPWRSRSCSGGSTRATPRPSGFTWRRSGGCPTGRCGPGPCRASTRRGSSGSGRRRWRSSWPRSAARRASRRGSSPRRPSSPTSTPAARRPTRRWPRSCPNGASRRRDLTAEDAEARGGQQQRHFSHR